MCDQEHIWLISDLVMLGTVEGPVFQANGRLKFKDDVRSEGLFYYVSDQTTEKVKMLIKRIDMVSCLEPTEIRLNHFSYKQSSCLVKNIQPFFGQHN